MVGETVQYNQLESSRVFNALVSFAAVLFCVVVIKKIDGRVFVVCVLVVDDGCIRTYKRYYILYIQLHATYSMVKPRAKIRKIFERRTNIPYKIINQIDNGDEPIIPFI